MNARLLVAAPVLAVALAACGGSGGSSPAASRVDTSTPEGIAKALTANGVPCSDYKPNPAAVGPKASGDCGDVTISTFQSAAQRDSLLDAFGADGPAVVGGAWLVTGVPSGMASPVAKALGGRVEQ